MNTNRVHQQSNRPTSRGQKMLSSALAVGVFFGIGGLLTVRSAQSAETIALASSASASTQGSVKTVSQTKTVSKTPIPVAPQVAQQTTTIVHATTKASKG
ncbi:MAG: hypothetical protein F2923_05615 [Actinobacteria bacterium]|nr:hypothetical protein [Actinomycetota bacterium]MTB28101.1 hypothetical protein [Actinomycetota bacterium]